MTDSIKTPPPFNSNEPGTTPKKAGVPMLERKYLTRRWVLVYLLLVVRICQTALRQCIGMALVCMTHINCSYVAARENASFLHYEVLYSNASHEVIAEAESTAARDIQVSDREFHWSSSVEGHVLGSYYYGFLLTVMVAGYVDRGLGSVRTIAVGIAGGGLVNLLTPVLTRQHAYLLVALRVLAGCANGVIDPATHSLLSRWAPVSERGQLAAVEYGGVAAAGSLTFLISAFLCKIPVDNGWPFVFYFYGSVSLLFSLLWSGLARDSPETHSSITHSELEYITTHRSELPRDDKGRPPWLKIMSSGAVWAIMVAHISFSWVYSWILAYLPMYMEDVLHYDIAENGMLSSLPFLAKLITGVSAGYAADMLLHHNFSIVVVRKAFQMVGSVGCAVPILIISFLSHEERVVAVVLLVLSVSLQNLTSVAYRINSLDIAPRYASYLMGMTSSVACGLTLTGPYITSALLVTKSREEWQTVLYIVSAVSVLGGVVFLLCARGSVQPWARDMDRDIKRNMSLEVTISKPENKADSPEKNHCSAEDDVAAQELLTKKTNPENEVTESGNSAERCLLTKC